MGRRSAPAPRAEPIEISSDSGEDAAPGDEQPVATVGDVPLYAGHRAALLSAGGWLADAHINAYGRTLSRGGVHCCSSFFYPAVARRRERGELRAYMRRWRATAAPGARLFLVPVNWGNAHWALVAVDTDRAAVSYYDSLMSVRHARAATRVVCAAFAALGQHDADAGYLSRLLGLLSLRPGAGAASDAPPASYSAETPAGQQQQGDGSSCGVFVCWRMAQLARAHAESTCDPAAFRRRICASIFGDAPAQPADG